MTDVTCPHCGIHFQIEEPTPTKKKPSAKKTEAMIAYFERWNAFAEENGLPKVREHNTTIQSQLFTRMRESGFPEDFDDALQFIKTHSFYRGINDTKWKASLEYLLRPGKATELASKHRAENDHGTRAGSNGSARLLSRTNAGEDF